MFEGQGLAYRIVDVSLDLEERDYMFEKSGVETLPQIFVNDTFRGVSGVFSRFLSLTLALFLPPALTSPSPSLSLSAFSFAALPRSSSHPALPTPYSQHNTTQQCFEEAEMANDMDLLHELLDPYPTSDNKLLGPALAAAGIQIDEPIDIMPDRGTDQYERIKDLVKNPKESERVIGTHDSSKYNM